MFKVKILTFGKTKDKWLIEALFEYEKRLSSFFSIKWTFAKDEKHLLSLAKQEKNIICLEAKGKRLTSEEFSSDLFSFLEKNQHQITFVIGHDKGIPSSTLALAKNIWSLSNLTFTHQITRLILLEQIYRAKQIQDNHPYHK